MQIILVKELKRSNYYSQTSMYQNIKHHEFDMWNISYN